MSKFTKSTLSKINRLYELSKKDNLTRNDEFYIIDTFVNLHMNLAMPGLTFIDEDAKILSIVKNESEES